jgi:hypothetical protein
MPIDRRLAVTNFAQSKVICRRGERAWHAALRAGAHRDRHQTSNIPPQAGPELALVSLETASMPVLLPLQVGGENGTL